MRKIEVAGRIEKGNLTLNSNAFVRLCKLLDDGNCVITVELRPNPKTIEEYRAHYFAMRDLVANETGNSREDIHEGAKKELLDGHSTKVLDEQSWQGFIARFKQWAFEHFNVYL